MVPRAIAAGLAAMLALAASQSAAVTLYKLVDKDGKVTYSDSPPSRSEGTVVPLEIEPGANRAQLPPPAASPPAAESASEPIIRRRAPPPDESGLLAARRGLEEARAALQQAQESYSPDDWIYLGNRGGFGARRAPRPQYVERLQRLEAEVKLAEERLAEAERRLRLSAR